MIFLILSRFTPCRTSRQCCTCNVISPRTNLVSGLRRLSYVSMTLPKVEFSWGTTPKSAVDGTESKTSGHCIRFRREQWAIKLPLILPCSLYSTCGPNCLCAAWRPLGSKDKVMIWQFGLLHECKFQEGPKLLLSLSFSKEEHGYVIIQR